MEAWQEYAGKIVIGLVLFGVIALGIGIGIGELLARMTPAAHEDEVEGFVLDLDDDLGEGDYDEKRS